MAQARIISSTITRRVPPTEGAWSSRRWKPDDWLFSPYLGLMFCCLEPHIAPEHWGLSMKFSITIEPWAGVAVVVADVVVVGVGVGVVVVVVVDAVVVVSFNLRWTSLRMLLKLLGFLLMASKTTLVPTIKSKPGINIVD